MSDEQKPRIEVRWWRHRGRYAHGEGSWRYTMTYKNRERAKDVIEEEYEERTLDGWRGFDLVAIDSPPIYWLKRELGDLDKRIEGLGHHRDYIAQLIEDLENA